MVNFGAMLLNKDTPKLLYSAQSDSIIWKLKLDDEAEIMIWESRSLDKKVTFSAYDFKNEVVLLNQFQFEEAWLLGLVYIKNGFAYFHGYESEFSPVQKGVLAFNLFTQKIMWQNFSISIQEFYREGVAVFDSRVSPRKYQLLDLETGEFIQKINIKDLAYFKIDFPKIQTPEIVESTLIWETQHRLKAKGLDFLVRYVKHEDKYHQLLEIYKEKEVLFSDYLNTDIQKLSFDTFLLWHNRLIYLRNKREIVGYLV